MPPLRPFATRKLKAYNKHTGETMAVPLTTGASDDYLFLCCHLHIIILRKECVLFRSYVSNHPLLSFFIVLLSVPLQHACLRHEENNRNINET